MTVLRAVIVDDEEPARELLRALLAEFDDVAVVGELADGDGAVAAIAAALPDLVFLDVQMPGTNGLAVARELLAHPPVPAIVFVTAYDEYAVRAFEVNACDYLLKPFDAERLRAAVERVRARRGGGGGDVAMTGALRDLLAKARRTSNEPVVVKADGRHLFLAANEIEWIEAVGKEVRVHAAGAPLTVRESMNSIEARLDPARFLRVHRSAIVNRAHVRELQPWFKGDYVLILRRGTRVTTGRSYRAAVQGLLAAARGGG